MGLGKPVMMLNLVEFQNILKVGTYFSFAVVRT